MKKKIAVLTSGWSVDFVISVLKGMQKVAAENNIDLYVFTAYKFTEADGKPNTTGFAIFDLINYKEYDGIVITPNLFNDEGVIAREHKRILESGVPAVSISQPLEGLHFVNSENHEAFKKLILHLINEHNIKDLAYIGGPEGNPGAESNLVAYKEALQESEIELKEERLFLNADWTYDGAYEKACQIFKDKQHIPQGIVCINDWAAMAAIAVAAEHGFNVPNDIKVIGFDNVGLSTKVIPSITSVDLRAELIGEEAIRLLISKPKKPCTKVITAEPCYRQSCGCESKLTTEQIQFSQNFSKEIDKEQRFASQMRHLEDTFIKDETVESLIGNLQSYFERRHRFEGSNFAILLNEQVVKSLRARELTTQRDSSSYDKNLFIAVNIKDGNKAVAATGIPAKNLMPDNLRSKEPALYLFMPIYNQDYIHGYYVAANYLGLLENKIGYNWTRNCGTIIEKFRQTSIYRLLSVQFMNLSMHDALSGVLNRAGMERYAIELFEYNNSNNNETEIIFVDINNMKLINDKYGHLQGDFAVKAVGELLSSVMPENYLCIRYGGDEFVIVGTPEKEIDYCQKIKTQLEELVEQMNLPYQLSVSAGKKIFKPGEEKLLESAIKKVDEIMYAEKLEFHKTENGDRRHKKVK